MPPNFVHQYSNKGQAWRTIGPLHVAIVASGDWTFRKKNSQECA